MQKIVLLGILLLVAVYAIYSTTSVESFVTAPVNTNEQIISKTSQIRIEQTVPEDILNKASNTPLPKSTPRPPESGSSNKVMTPLQPYAKTNDLTTAQTICEKVTSADCNAFDNPDFNESCGISFDTKGTNSLGKTQIGGLYIKSKTPVPTNGIYTPTFGSSKQFAVNKDTCEYMQNDIACKTHKNPVGTKFCAQCLSDGSLHATESKTTKMNPTFTFYTNATELTLTAAGQLYTLLPEGNNSKVKLNAVKANGITFTEIAVSQIPIAEGSPIVINASGKANTTIAIAGYIQGPIQRGTYKMDINSIIDQDNGATPNVGGNVNGYLQINQIYGKPNLSLTGIMPFTFLSTTSEDAANCSNGPFITTKAGMDYISTEEPCYGADASPGNYGLPCLQKMFLSAGGTAKGTGYPKDATTAKVLLVDTKTKNPRSLVDIGQFLYEQSVLASTGRNIQGMMVSDLQWNDASKFMTGVAVAGPCQTKPGTALSTACLSSLFKQEGGLAKGTYNPANKNVKLPAAIQAAIKNGDKNTVQAFFKKEAATARNNALTNAQRAPSFQGMFGVAVKSNKQ
jgi:hypothetical protein